MIFFALFSHMVSLLAIGNSQPIAPTSPTSNLEIVIEHFPETLELPICRTSQEIDFIIKIQDNCFGIPDLSGFDFNGNAYVQSVQFTSFGATLYMRGNVFLNNDGDLWTATIEDPLGNLNQASVNLNVSQATELQEPVITPPTYLHYRIPACESAVFGVVGFLVSDDCLPIDPAQVQFDDGGLVMDPANSIVVQSNPFQAYVEYAGDFTIGTYHLTLTYQDISESFTITVTQDKDTNAVPILPGNTDWILPGCEEELAVTFSVTVFDNCETEIDPSQASFSLGAENLEPTLNFNSYFEFLHTLTEEDDSTYLVASYENESGILSKDSVLFTVSSFCNTCPPLMECLGIENLSVSPSGCTANVAVPTPSIFGNVDTVILLAELYSDLTVELVNENGEPTGEFVTVEVLEASLEAVEGTVGNFSNELGTFPDLAPGIYRIRYTAVNTIGDTTLLTCPFQIEDLVAPTPICNDHLNIIVNGEETVIFQSSQIDEGSTDNCGPVQVEVRRSHSVDPITCEPTPVAFGPWSDQITFNSCDLEEVVTIQLRVWDDRNGDGIPGNTIELEQFDGSMAMVTDNFSVCSVEEEVYTLFHPSSLVGEGNNLDELASTTAIQLLQNAPNPFSEKTLIGFHLPQSTTATLKIHDLNGKVLYQLESQFDAGYHEVSVARNELKATGLLFYTLETTGFTATRKMFAQ